MQWIEKHIKTAENICINYTGSLPLQHELKNYFSKNKKHGSRDRKIISHLCYTYFRLGKALLSLSFRERLLVALFLCEENIDKWSSLFNKDYIEQHSDSLEDRIAFIQKKYKAFSLEDVFAFHDHIGGIDKKAFVQSVFAQPLTYLRTRPGTNEKVIAALENNGITFFEIEKNTLALRQGAHLQDVIKLNKDAVIQDLSSQKTAMFFTLTNKDQIKAVWDCCAASGGKTILAYDYFRPTKMMMSDIRESIIANLKKRLKEAGVPYQKVFIADLTQPIDIDEKFDLVICDAPCTGSGTWARMPEQLSYFKEEKINEYALRQSAIMEHIYPHIASGGYLFYITCSVFELENESRISFLQERFPDLQRVQSGYIIGYHTKADTMYAALLKKD